MNDIDRNLHELQSVLELRVCAASWLSAFEAALKAGRAALIHVRMDVEAISPSTTISKLRAAARGE